MGVHFNTQTAESQSYDENVTLVRDRRTALVLGLARHSIYNTAYYTSVQCDLIRTNFLLNCLQICRLQSPVKTHGYETCYVKQQPLLEYCVHVAAGKRRGPCDVTVQVSDVSSGHSPSNLLADA